MPRPTTSLIAFKAPVVKDREAVVLPICTEIGEWSELEMTPGTLRSLWTALGKHLYPNQVWHAPALDSAVGTAVPANRAPILKRTGKLL